MLIRHCPICNKKFTIPNAVTSWKYKVLGKCVCSYKCSLSNNRAPITAPSSMPNSYSKHYIRMCGGEAEYVLRATVPFEERFCKQLFFTMPDMGDILFYLGSTIDNLAQIVSKDTFKQE